MVWAKLDDAILDNPKIAEAGVVGFALHVAAITWCCRNLTDGFVPRGRVACLLDLSPLESPGDSVGNPERVFGVSTANFDQSAPVSEVIADHLVRCGLWRWDDERRGWWLKDFLEYNPSREKVLAERERSAQKKADSRKRRMHSIASDHDRSHRGSPDDVTTGVPRGLRRDSAGNPAHPDPDPDPLKKEERETRAQEHAPAPPTAAKRSKRKAQAPTELPADWEPSESCLADFRARGFDALGCLGRFRHYWREGKGAGTKRADWTLTFWNWAEREAKDGRLPLVVTPPAPPPPREPEPEYVPPPPEFAIEMAKALAAMPKARSWEDA